MNLSDDKTNMFRRIYSINHDPIGYSVLIIDVNE